MATARDDVRAGICWMIFSTACLATGNSIVRKIAVDLHPFQIGFLTNLIVLAVVWPALLRRPDPAHRTERRRLYTFTAIVGGISNLSWFYALANVPLAEATAITFAAPIIVTALAGVVFGEIVTGARWAAILAGFSGVMLIVRPGFAALDAGMVSVLVSTLCMSAMYMLSKQLTRVDSMARTAAMMTAIPVVVGLVPALLVWRMPNWNTIAWLLTMATAMYCGRLTMLIAFRKAPASTVMPFDFARLPFIAAIAYAAFGEVPDTFALLGSAMIVTASAFIAGEERRRSGQSLA
ncbi:DMT family transporter [Prosthecomicrobium sp. N25]|uniref:DMT family transporter n=1 Tax=Prosthecomicrobium sp. N25 TaxID=3129254 RepID=UPI003076B923